MFKARLTLWFYCGKRAARRHGFGGGPRKSPCIAGFRAVVRRSIAVACRSARPPPSKASRRPARRFHRIPIASDARLAGDGKQTRFILDLDQPISVHAFRAGRPLSRRRRYPAGQFSAPAGNRCRGAGADQGIPLRPRDARRLADRLRPHRPCQDRQCVGASGRQRPAGAARARTGGGRPDHLRAAAGARKTARASARDRRRQGRHRFRYRPCRQSRRRLARTAIASRYASGHRHRSRSWRPRQRHAMGRRERKDAGAGLCAGACATVSRKAANTASS